MGDREKRKGIEQALADVRRNGIRADVNQLTEDMTCQFKDYREWIREYVVNAYDAQARTCWITGSQEGEMVTIRVEDDGHGMGRQAVQDFFIIYRSQKRGDARKAVGRHGIGKLSAAAIPGQCRFEMTTSTGAECWHVKTGRLLDNAPVRLERLERTPRPGTRFEITFEKKVSVQEEIQKLHAILERYVQFLPLEILVFMPDGEGGKTTPLTIRGDWRDGRYGAQFYELKVGSATYDVALRVGKGRHEVYQNRVLVSGGYNLLCQDLDKKVSVPHLDILVDSADFKLPFGRHCLRDEGLLKPLSRKLRKQILPAFFRQFVAAYTENGLIELGLTAAEIEELAVALIALDDAGMWPWSSLPVFRQVTGRFVDLNTLRNAKLVYLDAGGVAGVDYSVFKAPVLSATQPGNGVVVLEKILGSRLINLATKDLVLEGQPPRKGQLGEREKRLQRHLRFHPEAMSNAHRQMRRNDRDDGREQPRQWSRDPGSFLKLFDRIGGVCQEAQHARADLMSTRFRVGYLVQRDGKTPNTTHRFLVRDQEVVLNLHHPEVRQLLDVADRAPALAGHWGLALCLTESKGVLPHLTPEAREDLILWDAMAKVGYTELPSESEAETRDGRDELADFIRRARRRSAGM